MTTTSIGWTSCFAWPLEKRFRENLLVSIMAQNARSAIAQLDPRKAVFTGTFDPLTLGHLDVIRRGSRLFDHLVVAIGVNPNKQQLFRLDERVALVQNVVTGISNVTVEPFHELAVQFVRRIGARVILRGVRTLSDMEYEFSMSLTNQRLDPEIETVFLMADGEFSHVSSSLIKQVARFGGADAVSRFVPHELVEPVMRNIVALAAE
jgi:pantetheine-phosphate adenylyltransferase